MEYGKIIAVTGLSGLFELLTSKNDGAIVKSLEDNSTRFVATRVHNFSQLESIEVFTTRENVNLIEVFQAIEKSSDALPDVKKTNDLKAYFKSVFPLLDQERVYNSDMKKMIKWFELLKKNAVEFKLTEAPESADQADTSEDEEVAPAKKAPSTKKETVAAAPEKEEKKATKAKGTAGTKAKAKPADDAVAGEEPKKKTAKKKKSDD